MPSLILDESVVSALDRACESDEVLKNVRQKVERLLIEFASTKKVSYKNLRVIHIATDRADIQPPLLRIIYSVPRLPGQTAKRHRRYMSENASCVRRLIRVIMGLRPKPKKGVISSPESVLFKKIPDYIKAILNKFPRERIYQTRGDVKDDEPVDCLTPNGQVLLLALCKVANTLDLSKELSPLSCLVLNHRNLIRSQIHAITSSAREYDGCYKTLLRLLKKLDLKVEAKEPISVKVENFPQPLREEYYESIQVARGKIPPSQLVIDSSKTHKFSIEVEETSIDNVTNAFCQFIGLIPQDETLSVVDLMRLEPTEVKTKEGVKIENRNSKIDWVREIERAKQSPSKRQGYDSENFRKFLYAIKFVAARNGYGHLIEAFNKAYILRLDKETKQKNKEIKKRGISREWIDNELQRLGAEFGRVVNKGLFKHRPGRKIKEVDRAMHLCLFYPQFLTKRLLGYRQQAIRKCSSGKNIMFLPDGTVVLHFDKDKVKNKRVLHMEIKPTEGGTHERLRTVLITYNKKVLPYLQKQAGSKLQGCFFATLDGRTGGFRAFKHAKDYEQVFGRRVREFLNVQELEAEVRDALHPHFLRGVCTDWMILDLHMSTWEAAEVLGDTEAVVRRDYLARNRVYDATKPFDRVNAERLRAKNELDGELQKKDRQIETLMTSLQMANSQVMELTARLAAIPGAAGTVSAMI